MSSINLPMPKVPITADLRAYYDYKSFKNNILYDYGPNKLNVPIRSGKAIVKNNYLQGDAATSMLFEKNTFTKEYTFIHLTKYNGSKTGRIWQSYSNNWLSGFNNTKNGVCFHGKWITQHNMAMFPLGDWILSVDTARTYRANKINLTKNQGFDNIEDVDDLEDDNDSEDDDTNEIDINEEFGMVENFKGFRKIGKSFKKPFKGFIHTRKTADTRLSINISKKISAEENSDWGVVMALIYDRVLTQAEVTSIENFILNIQYKGYVKFFNPNVLKIPPTLPVKDGLVSYFDSKSFGNTTWYDYMKKNNAQVIQGGVTINKGGYLTGSTLTAIKFPKDMLSQNYTFVHISKYNGAAKYRIFTGLEVNWLSGFHNNKNNVAFHNEWITPFQEPQLKKNYALTDWMLSVDNLNKFRSNKKNMTLNNFNKKITKPATVAINTYGENSDWAVAVVLVYNRTLTDDETDELEDWLIKEGYQGFIKQSLDDLNYKCTPDVISPESELKPAYMGKPNDTYSEFEYASYNAKKLVPCSQEKVLTSKKLNNILCANWESNPLASDPELCNNAFKYFNLYKTDNPLVTKGNDINYSNKNTIEDSSTLFDLATYNTSAFPDTNTADAIKNQLQNIISQTPMKLGCCMRTKGNDASRTVSVRVPLSPQVAKQNSQLKKFNFERENLTIPEGTCPTNLYSGSKDCDIFYDLYCQNVANYFKQQGLNNDEFFKYAPECACYAPTEGTKNYAIPSGVPPKCYKEGCSSDNRNAYIDPISRTGQCNLTVCSSLIDLSGVKAGGNISVNPVVNNQCGSETNTSSSSTDTTGTPQGNDKQLAQQHKSVDDTDKKSSSDDQSDSGNSSSSSSSPSSSPSSDTSPQSDSTDSSSSASSSDDNTTGIIMAVVAFILIIALIAGAYYYFK